MLLKTPAWAGVWIFVIISGFFAGKRFVSTDITRDVVHKFYIDKFCKVLVPTWVFIFIAYVLHSPSESISLATILRFIFCLFNGSGAAEGIGASWYVFTLMWLYVLTPIICGLLNQARQRGGAKIYIWIFIALAFGLLYRVGGRVAGLQWYKDIYASPIGNLDLYVIGICLNYIGAQKYNARTWRISSVLGIVILNVFCSICYFYGESSMPVALSIYRYLCPTCYAVVIGYFILSWVDVRLIEGKGIGKIIRAFSDISFQFYLWHTIVLTGIAERFLGKNALLSHMTLLGVGFVLVGILAYCMTIMSNGVSLSVKTMLTGLKASKD